jgi:hypothetical protein
MGFVYPAIEARDLGMGPNWRIGHVDLHLRTYSVLEFESNFAVYLSNSHICFLNPDLLFLNRNFSLLRVQMFVLFNCSLLHL